MNYKKFWLTLMKTLDDQTSWGKEQLKGLMKVMELAQARELGDQSNERNQRSNKSIKRNGDEASI